MWPVHLYIVLKVMHEAPTFTITAVVIDLYPMHFKSHCPSGMIPRKEWEGLSQITKYLMSHRMSRVSCALTWYSENLKFIILTGWEKFLAILPYISSFIGQRKHESNKKNRERNWEKSSGTGMGLLLRHNTTPFV